MRKILRKFDPNFQHYVKKIEAQAKRCFSYKKTCIEKIKCTHKPDKFSWFLVISLEDPSTSNSSKDQLDNTGSVGNITTY